MQYMSVELNTFLMLFRESLHCFFEILKFVKLYDFTLVPTVSRYHGHTNRAK